MRKYFYGLFMKIFKNIFLILTFLLISTVTYAYEKLDFFDDFHIYTPYVYILQDDTDIDTIKVLVLFHNYEENNKDTDKKSKKEKKKKNKKDKDNIENNIIDENNISDDKQETYDFATESAKWEEKAEKEQFFIMGFDFFEGYESFSDKEQLDKINDRVLMEIDRIKNTCNTIEVKVYVAGTQFGGNIALLFNLLYDNYDGAVCMNISKPTKDIMKKIDKCEKKKFYFFHNEKNKDMNAGKLNGIKNKLTKKGAKAEIFLYKNSEDMKDLPQKAYFDAINKIR